MGNLLNFQAIKQYPGFIVCHPDIDIDIDRMKSEVQNLIHNDLAEGKILNTDNSLRPRNVLRSSAVLDFVSNPVLFEAMTELFGAPPILSSVGANSVLPGAPGMGEHRDYPYFAGGDPHGPLLCAQVILSLDGMDDNNGSTFFRSWSYESGEEDDKIFPITCDPGTLIVAHGAVRHGVSPNTSLKSRTNILASFTPYWVRPFNRLDVGPKFQDLIGANFADRIAQDLSSVSHGVRRTR